MLLLMLFLRGLTEAFQNFFGFNYSYGTRSSTEYIDEENYGWQPLRREAKTFQMELSSNYLEDIRAMSRYLYMFSPHYFGLIRTYIKYVFGKSYKISADDKKLDGEWQQFQKVRRWNRFTKELGKRFFRDGEIFILKETGQFINPSLISTPRETGGREIHQGVEGENPASPVAYHVAQGRDHVRVPAEEIIYWADKDSDEWRALPYFIAILTKCKNYDNWLRDRLLLNRIRASIALERISKKTSPGKGKSFADSKKTQTVPDKTTRYGEKFRRKIIEPGRIIDHSDQVEYKYLAPNLQAKDVAVDGRNIVLQIAAATGLPEYMVSGDSSNANYASHLVAEGTATKEFDSWMEFFAECFVEFWHEVQYQLGNAEYAGELEDPQITIPSIVVRDRLKETQQNEILFQNGVISLEEWQRREGIDPEKMKQEVDYSDLQ